MRTDQKARWVVRRILIALVVAIVAEPVAAQRTWIVDKANGPGADFTEIGDAVRAASAGDTIRVRTGLYRPFAVDKGVTIVSFWGAFVRVSGDVAIRDLPANQRFALKTISQPSFPPWGDLVIESCAGPVHVEFFLFFQDSDSLVRIRHCAYVSLNDVRADTCEITGSTVALTHSSFHAEPGRSPAMRIEDSRVVMSDSQAFGGPGRVDRTLCRKVLSPGDAVHALGSDIVLSGPLAIIAGGLAAGCSIRDQAPSIVGDDNTVTVEPGRKLVGAVQGRTTVLRRAIPAMRAQVLWPGGNLELWLHGPASAPAISFASFPTLRPPQFHVRPDPSSPYDPPWPGTWLATDFVVVDTGSIDSSGQRYAKIPNSRLIPPSVVGLPLVVQAVVSTSQGPQLSLPSVAILN